ncbi:alpha/beta fold hydrolase [Puniceicoccaceae bacterium K14]|nr:alpha/beta fold hydrolase [Puniceicoccaceae bacterium K14]
MIKSVVRVLLGFVILLGIVFALGPRVSREISIESLVLPKNLDAYLAESESRYTDIVDNAQKEIVWFEEVGHQTEYSIVYLHGFSATRQEVAPVSEEVAQSIGANVFYARFAGHGRTSVDAMLEASVGAWANDVHEALEIGKRIGKKVIVIATSSGATSLMTVLDLGEYDLHALILLSPNFVPADSRAAILTWPWGIRIAELIQGKEFTWKSEPLSEEHRKYWTQRMPTSALAPMAAMVSLANTVDFSRIQIPVCILLSADDQLVDQTKTIEIFESLGSEELNQMILIQDPGSPSSHLVAGNILAPKKTSLVVESILSFLSEKGL